MKRERAHAPPCAVKNWRYGARGRGSCFLPKLRICFSRVLSLLRDACVPPLPPPRPPRSRATLAPSQPEPGDTEMLDADDSEVDGDTHVRKRRKGFHGYLCPHCGAGVGFNAKRCRSCSRSVGRM